MIIYKQTSLLDARVPIIAHGANCRNTMGGGVAKLIAKKFPSALAADTDLHRRVKKDGTEMLGKYSVGYGERAGKFIVNLYTQLDPGANFDEEAFEDSLCALFDSMFYKAIARTRTGPVLAIPMIGCGIGGSSWCKVVEALKSVLNEHEEESVVVCYLDEHPYMTDKDFRDKLRRLLGTSAADVRKFGKKVPFRCEDSLLHNDNKYAEAVYLHHIKENLTWENKSRKGRPPRHHNAGNGDYDSLLSEVTSGDY